MQILRFTSICRNNKTGINLVKDIYRFIPLATVDSGVIFLNANFNTYVISHKRYNTETITKLQ